ncbi:dolichyl-phosphate-mannose--protein mannosyltransferase [Micromonospora sp. NPDC003197]
MPSAENAQWWTPLHTSAAYDHGVTLAATAQTDDTAPPGRVLPPILRRRLAPFDARLDRRSWIATAVVVAIAAILRLVNLAHPKGKIFDEIYYATDAHNLLTRGFEWDEKNNTAAYVVHPPLGKWMIALGEWAFGYNEFGWRISAAVVGTLSVLLVVRVGRRLFQSTALGCAAGLLMALDGFHLVLSRTALLDIFLLFFVFAAFGALVLDRDARRRRWLRAVEEGLDPSRPGRAGRPPFSLQGVPWWRLLAGVLLGCAVAVKWSALAFVLVFAVLVIFWEVGARRSAGVRRPWRDTFLDESGWLLLSGVLIIVTYIVSWSGWLLTDGGFYRGFRSDADPVTNALWSLFEYHKQALTFHTGLTTAHTYQSWPWQWLLLGRPVAFHWTADSPCGAANCAEEVLLLGTPILWWSFLPALAALAWLGIARRDWRGAAILLPVAAGLLPWFYYALDKRTMFFFYAAPALPFMVLAVVYVLGAIMSPAPVPEVEGSAPVSRTSTVDRRMIGAIFAGAYVLVVAICFAYFYPIYTGVSIPYADWSARMWLGGRWI